MKNDQNSNISPSEEQDAKDLAKKVDDINHINKSKYNISDDPTVISNASNYQNVLGYQVDPRTGTLQLTIAPPTLSGFLGQDITPTISYTQQPQLPEDNILGLPLGWGYKFSFIAADRVFINGQRSYCIDSNYPSGMQYYTLKDAIFKTCSATPFPYDKENKRDVYNVLQFLSGNTQYFDKNGRLIGIDDRFGNHVVFYYNREGTVFESKLAKIVDSYNQEITFSYPQGEVQIAYPTGGNNNIQFSYLTDPHNEYLIGYKDPMGQIITITNKGGLNREDLISLITYPNNSSISLTYTSLYCLNAPNLDAVAQVSSTYKDQTRITSYNYDPNGDAHNFTGNPYYSSNNNQDALLESNDNEYRYVTRVNDGILLTEHSYNHLHLELETKIFTVGDLSKPIGKLIGHTVNTYYGETEGGYFPLFNDLRIEHPNYQTPTRIVNTVYNDKGEAKTSVVESDFDDYGHIKATRSYKSITGGSGSIANGNALALMSKDLITYDYDNLEIKTPYGQVTQKDSYDYQLNVPNTDGSNPVIRRVANTLTEDGKNLSDTKIGYVNIQGTQETFVPSKQISFAYDSTGRIIWKKLEWIDQQQHTLESTTGTIKYEVNCPQLTVTRINTQGAQYIAKIDTTTGFTTSTEDPLGNTTTYTYDNLGRRLTVTDPLGTTTKYVYDDAQNKVTTQYTNAHETYAYETYVYGNGFGEEINTADNLGGSERILSTKTYNNLGQLIFEEGILGPNSRIAYEYNDRGGLATATDPLGNITSYEYDPAANTKTTSYNNNVINTTTHNDNSTLATNYSATSPTAAVSSTSYYSVQGEALYSVSGDETQPNWYSNQYSYDAMTKLTGSNSTGVDGLTVKSQITRDLFDNSILTSISVTQAGGGVSTAIGSKYTYNDLNLLTQESNSLNQNYDYTYNAAGLLQTYTDYAGTVFTSIYNANGQVISKSHVDKAGKLTERKFIYFPVTNLLQSVEEIYDGASRGLISYNYALNGSLISITYPDNKQINIEYDIKTNLLAKFTDVTGQVTQYSYDQYGRVTGLQIANTNYNVSFSYYSKDESSYLSGKLKSTTNANGIVNTYTYNGFGAIQGIEISNSKLTTNNILLNVGYTYDSLAQNITQVTYSSEILPSDMTLNCSVAYTYDTLNRLIKEERNTITGTLIKITEYTYDAADNVTQESITDANNQTSSTSYTYDSDNKLITITSISSTVQLTYDVNGNLINDGMGGIYTYDARNNLINYQDNNGVKTVYIYYPNGLRASKQIGDGEPIQFYYDHSQYPNIVNEIQGSQNTSYLILGNERYVRLISTNGGIAKAQYPIQATKDIIGILDDSYTLVDQYDYSAYGQVIESESDTKVPQDTKDVKSTKDASVTVEQRDSTTITIVDNPFQYTKEYCDMESGLIYLRARYYNPRIKRFISRDTTHLINRYSYANGNPIMNTDPSGHDASNAGAIALDVILLVVGIAVDIVATMSGVGAAADFAANTLISAGVSGLGSINDGEDAMLTNTLIGAVSGGAGGVACGGLGRLAEYGASKVTTTPLTGWRAAITRVAIGTATNAGVGAVAGGIQSAVSGQGFGVGAELGASLGAVGGFIGAVTGELTSHAGIFNAGRNRFQQVLRPRAEATEQLMRSDFDEAYESPYFRTARRTRVLGRYLAYIIAGAVNYGVSLPIAKSITGEDFTPLNVFGIFGFLGGIRANDHEYAAYKANPSQYRVRVRAQRETPGIPASRGEIQMAPVSIQGQNYHYNFTLIGPVGPTTV